MTEHPPDTPDEHYQGPGTAAQTSTIYHADIDPAFQDLAKQNLWSAVQGNSIKQDDIKVTKFEGETLEFIGATILKLSTKTADKRQAGKVTGPTVLGSEHAVREEINREEHKITHSQDVIKRIKDVLLERPDKGFFLEREFIKLPFLHKQFVVYEPCGHCKSQGKIPCNRCNGKGMITCPTCNGSGSEICPACNGRQFIVGPNGEQQNCMQCNATGRVQCNTCKGQRQIQCPTCKGAGSMTCQNCNGHGWISHIFIAEIDAYADFDYDRENLPGDIVAHIDHLDKDLPHHVQINPVMMHQEQERDDIVLPYQIRIPHADVIFKIKSMEVGAHLFGTKGLLLNMPYFLEKIMGAGMKDLQKAGKGQGDIAQNLQKAGRYRTLRQIILAASKFTPKRALQIILEKNPIGLSEDTAKKLIILADRALRQITRKPRKIGAALGILLATTLYGAYLYFARTPLIPSLPNIQALHYTLDAAILIAGMTIAIVTIQTVAANAMKKTLGGLMSGGQKTGRIKAGKMAYWAMTGCLITFLSAAMSTLYTAAPPPHWVSEIAVLLHLNT